MWGECLGLEWEGFPTWLVGVSVKFEFWGWSLVDKSKASVHSRAHGHNEDSSWSDYSAFAWSLGRIVEWNAE